MRQARRARADSAATDPGVSGGRRRSPAPAPPLVHELVDDLHELAHRAALLHDVAGRRVERHHAVANAPAPLALRVEPDDALDALADLPDGPRLGVVVVVAGVPEDQHGGLPVERVDLRAAEAAERVAEVRPAVIVDRRALERPVDGAVDGIGGKRLRHLGDLGDEGVRSHAREALLETPHELEHEARRIAHGVRDVAHRDELRLLAVAAAVTHLHRDAPILEAPPDRAPRVEPPLLLLPLAQRERVLDLAREPGDHRLHLGDLVGRQGEQWLVGEHLAGEPLARAVRAPLELALDVLPDHPPERLEPQVEVVADAREHPRVHALGLEHAHDARQIALDRLPVELVVARARKVAGLEEVHEALEPRALAALATY